MERLSGFLALLTFISLTLIKNITAQENQVFRINEEGYYEVPGLNVMAFQDFYPYGHQGGITVIQNGIRVSANGDVRLEDAPGQWSPIPKKAGVSWTAKTTKCARRSGTRIPRVTVSASTRFSIRTSLTSIRCGSGLKKQPFTYSWTWCSLFRIY